MSSYAVLWSEPSCGVEVGKLELGALGLRFEGASGMRRLVHRLRYADIDGVRVGHRPGERLGGRPAVVVELAGGPVRIGSMDGVGTVAELADELTRLAAK